MKKQNVYSGKSSIHDFLNPENHVTPLIELNDELNPYLREDIHIYIKLQTFLPLMNVKSIPAYSMMKNDVLKKSNIVESSSGNMAFSLSILSRNLGGKKMKAIVSNETSLGKIQQLLIAGSEIWINEEPICPNPHSPNSGIKIAEKIGNKKGWKNFNQYANKNNPYGHYRYCGKQILEQLENDLQIFCTSMGTTGSMCGISECLKETTSVVCVGVVRKPNNPVPGPRTLNLLRMIDFNWKDKIDFLIEEGTEKAYLKSLELCRHGILVGPSSGLNLAGLLRFLKQQKLSKKLDNYRNKQGKINCVILGCDLPFLYLDEYLKYLPRSLFPKIYNDHLLKQKVVFRKNKKQNNSITARSLLKKCFACSSKILWKSINDGQDIKTNNQYILLDMRPHNHFLSGHIPTSINIEEKNTINMVNENSEKWQNKNIILICEHGELSYIYAKILQDKGYHGFSLSGGFIKWSEMNYPRISYLCPIRE